MKVEKVSIILPVYNGDSTIEDCIKSIFFQSIQDFKIYIINDGSTDDTESILANYTNDPRVVVIYQENSGVSVARNRGLEYAKGKYIAFVDADDTLESNYLQVLLKGFEEDNDNISLSVCNYRIVNKVQKMISIPKLQTGCFNKNIIGYFLTENGPQGYLWNKLFLSSVIKENNLKFDISIFMAEDLLFVVEYIIKQSGKIYITNDLVYNYMIYNGSGDGTRLSGLRDNYKDYFENFLYCLDKIERALPQNLKAAKQDVLGRKGRIATLYMRANNLMKNSDSELKKRLKEIAFKNMLPYFKGSNISLFSKIIYVLTLYMPKLVLIRDRAYIK